MPRIVPRVALPPVVIDLCSASISLLSLGGRREQKAFVHAVRQAAALFVLDHGALHRSVFLETPLQSSVTILHLSERSREFKLNDNLIRTAEQDSFARSLFTLLLFQQS